jgi:hypothetical protein
MEFDLSKVKQSNYDITKGLILPKRPSKELAEFIGILAGDGHVSFETKENKISISGNSTTDYVYFKKTIINLLKDLFNINCKVKKRKGMNAIEIKFNSKSMLEFLREIGYYKLKCKIIIPYWIIKNEQLHSPFLKGLFDTDGCIFRSNKEGSPNYPCIELTTACLELATLVKQILLINKFKVPKIRKYQYSHSNNFSYKVSLYGYNNLEKWINEIGFSNIYKKDRAIKYKKWGRGNLNPGFRKVHFLF